MAFAGSPEADGVYLQARMEPEAECILVIIGATPEGRKELLGFHVGVRESAQSPLSGFACKPLPGSGTGIAYRYQGSWTGYRPRGCCGGRGSWVLEGGR